MGQGACGGAPERRTGKAVQSLFAAVGCDDQIDHREHEFEQDEELQHLFGEPEQDPADRQLAYDLTIMVKINRGKVDVPLPEGYPRRSVLETLEMRPGLANFLPENLRGRVTEIRQASGIVVVDGARFSDGDTVLCQRTGEKHTVARADYEYCPVDGSEPQTEMQLSSGRAGAASLKVGDVLVATKSLRYALLHQCAHYGTTESLKQLAKLDGVDFGLRDAHGQTMLDIARHRVDRTFLRDARGIMERKLATLPRGDPRAESLRLALSGDSLMLHRGTLSNVMHYGGTLPAPLTQSAEFMCRCRASARLARKQKTDAFKMCIDEDWLFARLDLLRDPVVQSMKEYFECALPVHRTRHEALGSMLAGGALIGKKRLADFVASLQGTPQQCDAALEEMAANAAFNLSEEFFWTLTAQDVPPSMRRVLSDFIQKSLRLQLHGKSDEADLPEGVNAKGTLNVQKRRREMEQIRSTLEAMSEDFERMLAQQTQQKSSTTADAYRGMCNMMERKDLLTRLEDEVHVLSDGLLTFIKLSAKGGGISYEVDSMFGTDYSLFATLGPNGNDRYGSVALAFKGDILAHPDTDFVPMAATLYRSKTALCVRRPWVVTGVQAVPVNQLPTVENAGFGFQPPESGGGKGPGFIELLEGRASLTDTQGMYAWKMNQMNAGFSKDWAEVLARETCATARLWMTGMRDHFRGQGKFLAAADPYSREFANGKPWRVVQRNWRDPAPVVGHQTAWPQRITSQVVIDYYESCEAHARAECHLPGVLHMQTVDHIWMTQEAVAKLISHEGMVQSSRVGEMMASSEGLVLPDGRVLRVEADRGRFRVARESQGLLTICNDNQELFDQQCRFFRARRGGAPIPRPLTSFRTQSGLRYLNLGIRWLPCLGDHGPYLQAGAESWKGGVAVSFMSNAGDGLEVAFAMAPYQEADGEMYCVNIGKSSPKDFNGSTQLLRVAQKAEIVKATVAARTSPKSMCATAGGGGGCWQRYWAGVSYDGWGGAWLLFGRLGAQETPPKELKMSKATAKLKLELGTSGCKVYGPARIKGAAPQAVCLPVLYDPKPIPDIRYIGFSCYKSPKLICQLEVHPAPKVTTVYHDR